MNKLEKYSAIILLILIPFQARKVLFGIEWSFNEWTSFSIYLTDIILFGLVAYWIFNVGWRSLKPQHIWEYVLLGFIGYCALSVFWSIDRTVAIFYLVRVIEFSLFFLYLSRYALKSLGLDCMAKAFIAGGVVQSIIGLTQYLIQRDIGLGMLGESVIGSYISGTAAFLLENGDRVVRAYGLTPHANVYSLYLLLSTCALLWLVIKRNDSRWIYLSPILIFGIGVGYSRAVLLILMVMLGLFFIKSIKQRGLRRPALILLISGLLFVSWQFQEIKSRILISGGDEAVVMREFYNKEAVSGDIQWLGVGLGNFVPWSMVQVPNLPMSLYQPVHNVPLLLYREIGVSGLAIFIFFIIVIFRHSNSWGFRFLFLSLLFLMFLDHYLLTLQQGRFVLWYSLALLTHRE